MSRRRLASHHPVLREIDVDVSFSTSFCQFLTRNLPIPKPHDWCSNRQIGGICPVKAELYEKFSLKISKFSLPVTMIIRIGLKQILIAQLNWPTPKTPCLVQESRTYLLYESSYSQFCVEITTISYHGNKGRSGVSLNDTIRWANPENTQFSTNKLLVSSAMPDLVYYICSKMS